MSPKKSNATRHAKRQPPARRGSPADAGTEEAAAEVHSAPPRLSASAGAGTGVMVPLATLSLNPRNPRTITDEAFAKLCASIERDPAFMALRPIVVDQNGMILGGNMRYRACQHLGKTEVPASWVIRATDLTAEQRKRFVILDNQPEGMAGTWDWDILGADWEIPDLEMLGMDFPEMKSEPDPRPPSDDFDAVKYCIVIRSATSAEQRALFEELTGRNIACRLSNM